MGNEIMELELEIRELYRQISFEKNKKKPSRFVIKMLWSQIKFCKKKLMQIKRGMIV